MHEIQNVLPQIARLDAGKDKMPFRAQGIYRKITFPAEGGILAQGCYDRQQGSHDRAGDADPVFDRIRLRYEYPVNRRIKTGGNAPP